MTAAERFHGVVESGKQALNKVGVLGAPARDLTDATRSLTVGKPIEEVRAFWADPTRRDQAFRAGTTDGAVVAAPVGPADAAGGAVTGGGPAASGATISWDIPDGGRAIAGLKTAPQGLGTEVRLSIHVEDTAPEGRPRYGAGASVIALRALHGCKALMETGEAPTLTGNPAARPEPDPYALRRPNAGGAGSPVTTPQTTDDE